MMALVSADPLALSRFAGRVGDLGGPLAADAAAVEAALVRFRAGAIDPPAPALGDVASSLRHNTDLWHRLRQWVIDTGARFVRADFALHVPLGHGVEVVVPVPVALALLGRVEHAIGTATTIGNGILAAVHLAVPAASSARAAGQAAIDLVRALPGGGGTAAQVLQRDLGRIADAATSTNRPNGHDIAALVVGAAAAGGVAAGVSRLIGRVPGLGSSASLAGGGWATAAVATGVTTASAGLAPAVRAVRDLVAHTDGARQVAKHLAVEAADLGLSAIDTASRLLDHLPGGIGGVLMGGG